jgi:hypothetical protein
MSEPFEHCCGLQGFGQSLFDMCPACTYHRLIREGVEEERAVLLTKIEDYKSSAVLHPHLKKFCLRRAAELEAQLTWGKTRCRS